MLVVPFVIAFTTPVVVLIVATAGFELLHVPPGVELVNVVVLPVQSVVAPVIGPTGFTVTGIVLMQPAGVV